jgi:hypothetical protein
LILVNIFVIVLDATILAFQYAGLYELQTSWKSLAYAIGLKLEFYVLNQLVDFTKRGFNAAPRLPHIPTCDEIEGGKMNTKQVPENKSHSKTSTYRSRYEDISTDLTTSNALKPTEGQISLDRDVI